MTSRNLLNPNSLPPEPSPEQIRRALVDIWYLVGEFPPTVSDATGDYTTTGNIAIERIVATNTVPITIYLHETPADGDAVLVKRQNGLVTIDGQDQLIDGQETLQLGSKYDSVYLIWTDEGGEWSLMSYFAFNRDAEGRVLISDQDAAEALEQMINWTALLCTRVEEGFETGLTLEDVEDGYN